MAIEKFDDPYSAHYFALELDNEEVGHFMECSGLKSTCTVFEIEEGGLNSRTHKRPGQNKWENIVLRYATNTNMTMVEWRDSYLQGKYLGGSYNGEYWGGEGKRDGSIKLMNAHGDCVVRYSFTNAWPVSWEGPSLSGDSSALAIETIEIAHDGLTISYSEEFEGERWEEA